MRRKSAYALLATVCVFVATPSHAVPIQITVQATMTREPFLSSHFGITDLAVPIQVSFVVESDAVTTFAAGTPLVPSGAGFNSNAQLVSASAISNFVANVGNMSFSGDQFAPTGLGTTGIYSDVLLLGDFVPNGISGVTFSLFNDLGTLNISSILCGIGPSCSLTPYGFSEDYLTGSVADISGIQTYSQVLIAPATGVPEPGTLALLALALSGLVVGRRRTSD